MSEILTNSPEYTVSEISNAVKRLVEDQFDHVRIRGEVSRMSRPGSGHIYFDLKDDRSVISAVAWKGTTQRWKFQPEQGLEVIVTGRLTTFPGQSKYQIVVESVEPAGLGALMALLEERRKKLLAEGLFAPERKKQLPYLPRVIGVVTSPSGAVIRDILHRLADRFPSHVVVWPVRVQGDGCAAEVSAAVRGFNNLPRNGAIARPDLLIVARGGGSVEDLWGFNEEAVVRAVAESDIPVISAVGHETDVTLVDYAADVRAPTPTGAAEMAVPVRAELIAVVDEFGIRIRGAVRRRLVSAGDRLRAARAGLPKPAEIAEMARQRLDFAGERLRGGLRMAWQRKAVAMASVMPRLSPLSLRRLVLDRGQQVGGLAQRSATALTSRVGVARSVYGPVHREFLSAGRRAFVNRRQTLETAGKLLASVDPRSILDRGFALVTGADGGIIHSAGAIETGAGLTLEFSDGKVDAIAAGSSRPATKPSTDGKKDKGGQTSLF